MYLELAGKQELRFPGGLTLQFQGKVPGNKNGYLYSSKDGEAIFTINPNRPGSIYGHVSTVTGKHFTLEFCGENTFAWKEMDIPSMEVGELPTDNHENEEVSPQLYSNSDDNTTIVEYSVKFYYTAELEADTADLEGFLQQIVDETNQGYVNSGIPLRIKSHCPEKVAIAESKDALNLLNAISNLYGKDYAVTRDGADVAALLVLRLNYCGYAWLNTISSGKTFSVTAKSCALGYYSFAHEVGHNVGTQHNKEVSTNHDFSYGHGHLIESGSESFGYRTISSYSAEGHRRRINYWSNPSVNYPLTGTPTGIAGVTNNAAVLTKQRFKLAALGDEMTGSCKILLDSETESGKIMCNSVVKGLKLLDRISKVADVNICQVECQKMYSKGCQAFNYKKKTCYLFNLNVRKRKGFCTGTPYTSSSSAAEPGNGKIMCNKVTKGLTLLGKRENVADTETCQLECQNMYSSGCQAFNYKKKTCMLLKYKVKKRKGYCTGIPY